MSDLINEIILLVSENARQKEFIKQLTDLILNYKVDRAIEKQDGPPADYDFNK